MSGLTEDSWIYILFLLQVHLSRGLWNCPVCWGRNESKMAKNVLIYYEDSFDLTDPLKVEISRGPEFKLWKSLDWRKQHYFCSSVPTHFSVSKAGEPVKLCQDLPVNSCGLVILSFWWEWIRHWDLITKSISFIVTGLVMFWFSSWLIFGSYNFKKLVHFAEFSNVLA